MADVSQLSRLMKRADAVSHSAAWLVARAIRDVRGEIANLSGELNLAGNADDRERAYSMVRRRMDGLSRRLDRLLEAQQQLTAKGAAKSAATLTGLEVKYSPSRAKAICELVTPAQGENLAAVFTDRMGAKLIGTLREATVATLREQAVSGGTMKETARRMAESWQAALKDERPVFVDSGGHAWNTETYFQMNVRTNTMRVYNDCLADNVARATGSDLMRISTGGSDPNCECAAWEGCIVSLTGKTPGFPTYEDARKGGCFHPNCVHTLEPVDETADADEIKLQKAVPADGETASDWEAQDERKYEIDQARKMRDEGLTREQARVAVDRDNLAASIRAGLVRGDAEAVVRKMTDAQVTALCPNGNPPEFLPTKRIPGGTRANPKYEPEKWNHGKWGGVVHIGRDATAEQILKVCKVEDAKAPEPPATPPKPVEKPKPEPAPAKKPEPKPKEEPKDKPQEDPIAALKTVDECREYISKQLGVAAVGFKDFKLEDVQGITREIARARDAGLNSKYCKFVSTGQEMLKDADAKKAFLEARASADSASVLGLAFYARKGIKKGYSGTDAEWYGFCQTLRATGRTYAHCIRFYNPILQRFNGIYFNAKMPNKQAELKADVESGWHPPGADSIRGIMAHELGHALDSSIGELRRGIRLSTSAELIKYIGDHGGKNGVVQGLSRYAATKDSELVAEAWCECSTNKEPRQFASDVGKMILSALGKGKSDAGTT